MTQKVYYLSTCNTCNRIFKDLNIGDDWDKQDVKADPIRPDQIDEMKRLAGSYEALFSRKSMKYRAMGLHEKTLSESDYRRLILEEYTFLKRPVFIVGERIFIGNTKKVLEELQLAL